MPFLTVETVQTFQNGRCVICFSLGRISYILVYMSVYITYTACNRRYTTGLWKASVIRIFTFVAGFLLCQVTCQYTVCILENKGYNEWPVEGKDTDFVYFTNNYLWFFTVCHSKICFRFLWAWVWGFIRIENVSVIMIVSDLKVTILTCNMLVKQDQNVEEWYSCTELPYLCQNYIIYIQSAIFMSKTAICISKSGDLFSFYI